MLSSLFEIIYKSSVLSSIFISLFVLAFYVWTWKYFTVDDKYLTYSLDKHLTAGKYKVNGFLKDGTTITADKSKTEYYLSKDCDPLDYRCFSINK